ncbi:hypothetical protein IRY61_04865 [Candidatus Saccharibacteria bacterium]|nr:hypothetical protein [Candidatus Saccharibacteria bacterium]
MALNGEVHVIRSPKELSVEEIDRALANKLNMLEGTQRSAQNLAAMSASMITLLLARERHVPRGKEPLPPISIEQAIDLGRVASGPTITI